MCTIMLSAKSGSLILLFQFGFLLFLFLLWLLCLGLPKLCWIKVVRVDIFVLFLFQFFTMENDVSCGFFIYGFFYVEVSSLYAHFPESFYHKSLLNFIKSFFCIRILFFNLLMWCIIFIDLRILKNPCIPGINPTWSWCMILLMYSVRIWFVSILLRIFASMFISDINL